MQVVLLQDVRTLGKKGDIVKVNDGYARNFILPRKLGVEATKANLAQLEQQKKYEAKVAAESLAAAQALGAELNARTVTVKAKVGEGGRLFGAVSAKDVAEALKAQCGLEVDKKKIVLPDPIKALGTYQVPVRLHKDVTAKLALNVKALQ